MRDVERDLRLYAAAKTVRQRHEPDWRKAAAYCLPAEYSRWLTEGDGSAQSAPLGDARRVAYDTTGARALPKFVSILERLATPEGQRWHTLQASNEVLRNKRRVKEYFQDLTNLLFKYRYNPNSRFRTTTNETYLSLGVYGTGPLFVGERKPTAIIPGRGLKYVSCPLRDIFILVDDDGNLWGVFRRFWLNAREFKLKFPHDVPPPRVQAELNKPTPDEMNKFEIVQFVKPRDAAGYDPEAIDDRRHPLVGRYFSVGDKAYIGSDEGFQSMPYKVPRTATVTGDPYGFSPAVLVLPALGGASQMKKTNLKQGNLAVAPVILAADDGVMNGGGVSLKPSAINYGAVSARGEKLIHTLDAGNFRVGEVLLQDEQRDINDSFFVTLFEILTENPEMTATQVMERVAEKASLLSPTMGRLQGEFLGPMVEREIDIFAEMGILSPPPPELVEAAGEYELVYTSPMAKGQYAEEVSGFMRSAEMALGIAGQTGDNSPLDHFDFDTALPEIMDRLVVPVRWVTSAEKVKQMREQRAQQTQQSELMANAPALASAAKTASDMQSGGGK